MFDSSEGELEFIGVYIWKWKLTFTNYLIGLFLSSLKQWCHQDNSWLSPIVYRSIFKESYSIFNHCQCYIWRSYDEENGKAIASSAKEQAIMTTTSKSLKIPNDDSKIVDEVAQGASNSLEQTFIASFNMPQMIPLFHHQRNHYFCMLKLNLL